MFESHFQTFTETADPSQGRARVGLLRGELRKRGLQGFIIPRSDEHQNEYVPPCAERLAWLTGFTGSAGFGHRAARRGGDLRRRALHDPGARAGGRENLRARRHRADAARRLGSKRTPSRATASAMTRGCMTPGQVRRFADAAKNAGASSCAVDDNPLDHVWSDRPAPPLAPICLHPEALRGRGRRAANCSASQRRWRASMRWSSAIRMRSRGLSTFAGRMSRTRRCRSPSR